MNRKSKDRLAMCAAVLVIAVLMAATVWMVSSYSSGILREDSMYILASFLSGAMMLTVLLYGVYVFKGPTNAEAYQKMLEEKNKKGE